MKRYSLGWYRMRAIFGLVFGALGVVIGYEILVRPSPWNSKLVGLAFVAALIGLALVRARDYVRARERNAP